MLAAVACKGGVAELAGHVLTFVDVDGDMLTFRALCHGSQLDMTLNSNVVRCTQKRLWILHQRGVHLCKIILEPDTERFNIHYQVVSSTKPSRTSHRLAVDLINKECVDTFPGVFKGGASGLTNGADIQFLKHDTNDQWGNLQPVVEATYPDMHCQFLSFCINATQSNMFGNLVHLEIHGVGFNSTLNLQHLHLLKSLVITESFYHVRSHSHLFLKMDLNLILPSPNSLQQLATPFCQKIGLFSCIGEISMPMPINETEVFSSMQYPCLEHVIMSRTGICADLVPFLPLKHTLKELDVDSCGIKSLKGLIRFTKLVWLNISNNTWLHYGRHAGETVTCLYNHCARNLNRGEFHLSCVGVNLRIGEPYDLWLRRAEPVIHYVRCFPTVNAGVTGSVMPGGECRNFSWWPRTIPFQTCVGIEYLQELTFVDSEGEGEGQELSVMGGSGESEDEGEDGGRPTEGELV